jgi:hypothetical protein
MTLPTDNAARKRLQMWTFLMEYFPDAFLAVVEVAVQGNEQHNPGQRLHWAREKSTDQMNTAFRHMWDYGTGLKQDTDGCYHLAKAIWRLSAQLQLDIEADRVNQHQAKPQGLAAQESGSPRGDTHPSFEASVRRELAESYCTEARGLR